MPVHTGSIVLKAVLNSDPKSVAPIGTDRWSRVLTVDGVHKPGKAVDVARLIANFKIVANYSTSVWPSSLNIGIDAVATTPALAVLSIIDAEVGQITLPRTVWSPLRIARNANQLRRTWSWQSIDNLKE